MTIKKRLARSNIAMLVIPLLVAAALLLLLGVGAVLLLLRENMTTLHDAMEQMERVLHGFKLTLSIYAAAAVAVLLAAAALTDLYLTRSLFRHISRPLDTLTAGVARIRDGDLDAPIAYDTPDEFKAACNAVDEMAARLKTSLEQQAAQQQKQELMAGMSHDLKSPLTAIRAYTEGLLEGVAQDEATRQRQRPRPGGGEEVRGGDGRRRPGGERGKRRPAGHRDAAAGAGGWEWLRYSLSRTMRPSLPSKRTIWSSAATRCPSVPTVYPA